MTCSLLSVPSSLLALLLAVLATYVAQMGAAAIGFARIRRAGPPPPPSEWPTVSVIIPARNEAPHIGACLDSLRACEYPADRLEIIVVDDFSTDGTAEQVRTRQPAGRPPDDARPVRLVQLADDAPQNDSHKSAAIARGVSTATGEVILTTDADCTVGDQWIRSMVRRCTPDTPFVAGPVAYEHDERFLPRLQALELAGLVAYGAGTIGMHWPTFCNSANVAYRRDVLTARDQVPDGAAQDEMLLQYVAYETDRAVTFNPDPDALITTAPAATVTDYLRQQARWAQMGLRYPFRMPRLFVVGLWAAHTVLFLACAAALALPAWREPVLLTLLGKIGIDALLTVPAARHFGQKALLRSAVPTELLLLVAVPLVGILGTFGDIEWKGRELD